MTLLYKINTMAKIEEGILGAFVGRVGPVSGYRRNGQNIMRTASSGKDTKITPGRLAQREKMKVCNDYTRPFCGKGFFNRTFPAYGTTGTGHSRATSAIMNLAITGTFPLISISYPDVLISRGQLPTVQSATAMVNEEGNTVFTWTGNSEMGTAKPSDKVILVAYFPETRQEGVDAGRVGLDTRQVCFSIGEATRAEGTAVLKTKMIKGPTVETWIGFLSKDEKNASDSVYCGKIDL
jgi:uncharacterized protein DUF6266